MEKNGSSHWKEIVNPEPSEIVMLWKASPPPKSCAVPPWKVGAISSKSVMVENSLGAKEGPGVKVLS